MDAQLLMTVAKQLVPKNLSWPTTIVGVAILLTFSGAATGATVIGIARVLDGDTIKIGSTSIRLFGIDAPEMAQSCRSAAGTVYRCGEDAAERLRFLTQGRETYLHRGGA